jgi:phosphogluconate dehydratase
MPELHKLTPPLAVLQGKGFKVALVTDGRMSGASGKVPAAIHVSPEAARAGRWPSCAMATSCGSTAWPARWKRWSMRRNGRARAALKMPAAQAEANGHGVGRELFAGMRRNALAAEEGACTWL